MAREDIITALKNAVDRKEPLESAKKTLIAAGYPPSDVEAAAKEVKEVTAPAEFLAKAPVPGQAKPPSPKAKKKITKWLIIFIIAISLLVVGLLYSILKQKGLL